MAYSAVPTVTTGDSWSAANHNTYIRDNFAAGVPDIFTAAGDIAYGTAANVADVLPIGATNQALICSSDGLPEWGDILSVSYRQGASSSDWSEPGSTDFEITESPLMQAGSCSLTFAGANYAAALAHVTFPVKYSERPLVFLSWGAITGPSAHIESIYTYQGSANTYSVTTSDFYVDGVADGACNATLAVNWLAIGIG
jgi:hypothetical protein